MSHHPRPLLGLFAGIAAGLAASAAMAAFQAKAKPLLPDGGGDGDPATVKAADKVMESTTGDPMPAPYRKPAGQAVHYLTGAALGGLYGVLSEYRPEARTGFGSAYGIATSLLLDEAAVPAAGLGPSATATPPATHAYGVAAHLVYGIVLEGARRLFAGKG